MRGDFRHLAVEGAGVELAPVLVEPFPVIGRDHHDGAVRQVEIV
jgi:hypothetical protein